MYRNVALATSGDPWLWSKRRYWQTSTAVIIGGHSAGFGGQFGVIVAFIAFGSPMVPRGPFPLNPSLYDNQARSGRFGGIRYESSPLGRTARSRNKPNHSRRMTQIVATRSVSLESLSAVTVRPIDRKRWNP